MRECIASIMRVKVIYSAPGKTRCTTFESKYNILNWGGRKMTSMWFCFKVGFFLMVAISLHMLLKVNQFQDVPCNIFTHSHTHFYTGGSDCHLGCHVLFRSRSHLNVHHLTKWLCLWGKIEAAYLPLTMLSRVDCKGQRWSRRHFSWCMTAPLFQWIYWTLCNC